MKSWLKIAEAQELLAAGTSASTGNSKKDRGSKPSAISDHVTAQLLARNLLRGITESECREQLYG